MARPPRFFISPDQASGSRITITGEDVRHISAVLRLAPGDELLLCDGQGTEYIVSIEHADCTEVRTSVMRSLKRESRGLRVTLGQGLPKSDKMDWIVQKATELGVASIVPLVTERTIVRVKDEAKRVSRWQKICRESAMQSNRPDIPNVEQIHSFSGYLKALSAAPDTLLLIPWEEETTPIKGVLREHPAPGTIIVLIGPEGGFSKAEAAMARERGFQPVSLGRNILRTETAAVAVLSMIGYEFFDQAQS